MIYLVDTCVLLRAFDRQAAEHVQILQAIHTLWKRGDSLVVAVQNLAEFWNVSTRPIDKNGFGLSPERVAEQVCIIERFTSVATETMASFGYWKRIVASEAVLGVKVHDARLVSVMVAEGIPSILTLNITDFERYHDITSVHPSNIANVSHQ